LISLFIVIFQNELIIYYLVGVKSIFLLKIKNKLCDLFIRYKTLFKSNRSIVKLFYGLNKFGILIKFENSILSNKKFML